jgi:WXG100 family type VII secretion target
MSVALDHAVFDSVLRDVRDAAAELKHVREVAVRRVDALLQGGWTGVAAGSYAEAWGDWSRAADDVLAGLLTIGSLLEAAHADLAQRDLDSLAALDRVATRLHERLS